MKSVLILVITMLLLGLAGSTVAAPDHSISKDNLYRHISVLAHDSLEGRQIGEPGEWKAAQYIASVMTELGLEPKGDNDTYFQAFDFIKRIDSADRFAVNLPIFVQNDKRG